MKGLLLVLLLLVPVYCWGQYRPTPDTNNPLLKGQIVWWKSVPGFTMSTNVYDLLGRVTCALNNMSTLGSTTSGWNFSTRSGGFMHLAFDGSNDYVDCTTAPILTDIRVRSVALWANLAGFGTNNITDLVNKRASLGWKFASNNSTVTAGLQFIQDHNAGNSSGNWFLANVFTIGTWVHVGVTYDSTSTSNVPTFYVNGVGFAPSTTVSSPSTPYDSDASSALRIGGEDGGGSRNVNGRIDDVRIWSRILSPIEMNEVYAESVIGDINLLQSPTVSWMFPSGNLGTYFNMFPR